MHNLGWNNYFFKVAVRVNRNQTNFINKNNCTAIFSGWINYDPAAQQGWICMSNLTSDLNSHTDSIYLFYLGMMLALKALIPIKAPLLSAMTCDV